MNKANFGENEKLMRVIEKDGEKLTESIHFTQM